MAKRKKGLSFGSVLVILLTALAIFGTYYFIRTVASDSPVAAMGLSEIVDAFGKPFLVTSDPIPKPSPALSPMVSATAIP